MRQRLSINNDRWRRQVLPLTPSGSIRGVLVGVLPALLLVASTASSANASERRFAYSYEATTHAKGEVEFEQWVTWKTDKVDDSSFNRFDFRHELEFGVTDRFQVGLYLSDWRYERGDGGGSTDWRDVGVELIYNLTDPTRDALGSAIYGEVKFGDELLELEGKLILQKNIGKWALAWNGTIEAEWEGEDFTEDNGVFEQTLGASYQIEPHFLVGIEALHEIEFEDWAGAGDDVLYVGPNISVRASGWWFTIAPLIQVTSVDSEPDFQTRLLVGFDF